LGGEGEEKPSEFVVAKDFTRWLHQHLCLLAVNEPQKQDKDFLFMKHEEFFFSKQIRYLSNII